jgi:hypothetical protein
MSTDSLIVSEYQLNPEVLPGLLYAYLILWLHVVVSLASSIGGKGPHKDKSSTVKLTMQ